MAKRISEGPGSAGQDGGFAKQARAWSIGLNFVYGVIAFSLIGWALEKWVWPSAAPWVLLTGVFLGLIGGGYRFVREAISAGKS